MLAVATIDGVGERLVDYEVIYTISKIVELPMETHLQQNWYEIAGFDTDPMGYHFNDNTADDKRQLREGGLTKPKTYGRVSSKEQAQRQREFTSRCVVDREPLVTRSLYR